MSDQVWRIVSVIPGDERPADLTSSELVGISVLLTHYSGEPHDELNVYWRARQKIQPMVYVALEEDEPSEEQP